MEPSSTQNEKRVFTLKEARDMLPEVRELTKKAVALANAHVDRLEMMSDDDPAIAEVRHYVDAVVAEWVEKITQIGCEAKGLWLVDFDNGQGYYCWRFPEEELDHFHTYEQGFSARTFIC